MAWSEKWETESFPGLLFVIPNDPDSKPAPSLIGVEPEVVKARGDEPWSVEETANGLMSRLSRHLHEMLALWALRRALRLHEEQFVRVRDELAVPPKVGRTGRRLRRLQREVLPLALDIKTIESVANDDAVLRPRMRYSDLDFVLRRGPREPPENAIGLLDWLRKTIRESARNTGATGESVAASLRVQGELLLASSNVRMQWMVLILTLTVGVASVVATVTAASTTPPSADGQAAISVAAPLGGHDVLRLRE